MSIKKRPIKLSSSFQNQPYFTTILLNEDDTADIIITNLSKEELTEAYEKKIEFFKNVIGNYTEIFKQMFNMR